MGRKGFVEMDVENTIRAGIIVAKNLKNGIVILETRPFMLFEMEAELEDKYGFLFPDYLNLEPTCLYVDGQKLNFRLKRSNVVYKGLNLVMSLEHSPIAFNHRFIFRHRMKRVYTILKYQLLAGNKWRTVETKENYHIREQTVAIFYFNFWFGKPLPVKEKFKFLSNSIDMLKEKPSYFLLWVLRLYSHDQTEMLRYLLSAYPIEDFMMKIAKPYTFAALTGSEWSKRRNPKHKKNWK
ncbi:hypothetical protein RFI_34713 [Reticulomyxa filosa]|uniref:Uncharacterized protein n=1 Tax=Reticulomyxa filosa TaxID=46433 RepID=X6LPN7_RETFI|nr:hypothetical protein RFI_34713 [Reticulomyxa filosa]|eukprot:ETO02700.1 hypothetical protein RFI_34713 [Reticulomyxa filosa]